LKQPSLPRRGRPASAGLWWETDGCGCCSAFWSSRVVRAEISSGDRVVKGEQEARLRSEARRVYGSIFDVVD